MPQPLPPAADFTKEPMSARDLSDALVRLRDCVAGRVGDSGDPAGAPARLGALFGDAPGVTAARVLSVADRGRALMRSVTFEITLPEAAAAGAGWACLRANVGTGTVTIAAPPSDRIDGLVSAALDSGRAVRAISTGTDWRTMAFAGPTAGPVLLPDGTATAPALAFSGDGLTGLYRPSADVLGVATAGAERLRVTTGGMQVAGLITGSAVVADPLDAAAGRLWQNAGPGGMFGLGATDPLAPGSTADGPLRTAVYRVDADTTPGGWPAEFAGLTGDDAQALRLRLCRGTMWIDRPGRRFGTEGLTWRRSSNGTAPDANGWRRIYDSRNVVGAVAQSGGVPTGALIEAGSNANGRFVRFADGTQICRLNTEALTLNLTTAAAGGFRSANQTWTYPAAFAAAPAPAGASLTADVAAIPGNGAVGASQAHWNPWRATSQNGVPMRAHLLAICRWF